MSPFSGSPPPAPPPHLRRFSLRSLLASSVTPSFPPSYRGFPTKQFPSPDVKFLLGRCPPSLRRVRTVASILGGGALRPFKAAGNDSSSPANNLQPPLCIFTAVKDQFLSGSPPPENVLSPGPGSFVFLPLSPPSACAFGHRDFLSFSFSCLFLRIWFQHRPPDTHCLRRPPGVSFSSFSPRWMVALTGPSAVFFPATPPPLEFLGPAR